MNIMSETVASIVAGERKVRRATVLGGRVTWLGETYRPFLNTAGIDYVHLDIERQVAVERLIEEIKLCGAADPGRVSDMIIDAARQSDADCVILGCTEFGCVDVNDFNFKVADSSHELALSVVKRAANFRCDVVQN